VSQNVTPSTAPQETANLDEIVCKSFDPPTGSRLGARRICQTRREWGGLNKGSQQYVGDSQRKMLLEPPPGGTP
jgi:hypothetical protein